MSLMGILNGIYLNHDYDSRIPTLNLLTRLIRNILGQRIIPLITAMCICGLNNVEYVGSGNEFSGGVYQLHKRNTEVVAT